MKIYFAPLEGITGYIFRNAFHDTFHPKIDKYFSPFISPGAKGSFNAKELRDIIPENNKGIYLVPQILTNSAEDFLAVTKRIKGLGYDEVNINLGCPSGTVVSKKKGSGLLGDTEMLESMLDKIFTETDMKVSVKTRIGKENPDEFPKLLEIYNKFPMEELIIHPRVRNDFYKNTPNMAMFSLAEEVSKNRVCYNGDIVSKDGFNLINESYPDLESAMIGRGFLRNPMLCNEITDGKKVDKKAIRAFHDQLLNDYTDVMYGDRPVLFKMKEIWFYMLDLFEDSEKLGKKIKKAEKLSVYGAVIDELFEMHKITEC